MFVYLCVNNFFSWPIDAEKEEQKVDDAMEVQNEST